ncbi:hypothetical protein EDB87DRAFT_1545460, partial [Lactarius vividus]
KMKEHYIRMLHMVSDEADVVLLVLDPPTASWSRSKCEVENKRLVFVFDKIDPVPRENAQAFAKGPLPHDPNDALPPPMPGPTSLFCTAPAIFFAFSRCRKPAVRCFIVGRGSLSSCHARLMVNIVKTHAKVCSAASQLMGRTYDLYSVQLERVLRIVDSPGSIIDRDEGIQGQKRSSVLLCHGVKPEDLDEP